MSNLVKGQGQAQNSMEMNYRSNPIRMLNTVAFVMSFAFFILYPLLANYLISWKKIAVMAVTLIINIRIVVQDAFMLPGSYSLKNIDPQVIVALGCMIRGIGFLILALTSNLGLLIVAGVLAGIGGALFFPSMHALYTSHSNENNRLIIFARRERYNSLGAVLGPLLGSALARLGFEWVGIVSFFIFLAGSISVLFIKPQNPFVKNNTTTVPFRLMMRDKTFMLFAFASMMIMQISNQTGIAVAVRIDQINPSFPYIGVLSSISAIIMVLFQIHLLKALNQRIKKVTILMLADVFFILGFLVIGISFNTMFILLGSLLFSVGSMLHTPTRDSLLSKYANKNSVSAYYGVIGMFNTLGTLVFASLFGKLYQISYSPGYHYAPWVAFIVIGFVGIMILHGISDRIERA
ncbi:MAG: MFS transporter [Crenarchaeota archaeon]|nr:MFS transporter [Thermoproteota archaeon]